MSILFYDHLVDKQAVNHRLDKLHLPEDKRNEFVNTIDEILHAGLIEFILQKLHPHHHHTFLSQLERAPYDPELLVYLQRHIDDSIQEDIEKQSQRILKLILKDLKV